MSRGERRTDSVLAGRGKLENTLAKCSKIEIL
jgi:hypothetical protein